MYPVTHIVLATGAAWGAERVARRLIRREGTDASGPRAGVRSPFDYRLVALGAWLPDIIDKPLGWWVLDDPAYEHSFAHSLLFVWILAAPGLFLARRGDRRLLSIGFGDGMHVLCDPVMRTPEIFFWPLWGWEFDGVLGYAIEVHVPWRRQEALAASVAALVFLRLSYRDGLRSLTRFGRL
jgi:hypothetical protein